MPFLLRGAIEELPERERRIIVLRYFRDMTQSEVAERIGVSQVQVSRIESKIIKDFICNLLVNSVIYASLYDIVSVFILFRSSKRIDIFIKVIIPIERSASPHTSPGGVPEDRSTAAP